MPATPHPAVILPIPLSVLPLPPYLFPTFLDLYPVLNLRDAWSGEEQRYTGLYTWRVVGGGPSRAEVERYSAEDAELFNLHASTVWTFVDLALLSGVWANEAVLSTDRRQPALCVVPPFLSRGYRGT